MLLVDHPDLATILPWVKNDVSAHEFLSPYAKGVSFEQPFNPAAFPEEEIPKRVLAEFHEFGAREVATLVCRGCLVPFEEVRTIDGPVWPRVIMPLGVEP